MKRWIPPVAGVLLLVGVLVYWMATNKAEDAQPGVQLTPQNPSEDQTQDEESVEGLGDDNGMDSEDITNTFEMSEEGIEFQDGDGPMGQEMDGAAKSPQAEGPGLGSPGIETIDEDDGETLDPSVSKGAGSSSDTPQGTSSGDESKKLSNPPKP